MDKIRKLIQNPIVGWCVAGIAIVFAVVMLFRTLFSRSPYDAARLTENVTIRYSDSGDEVTMSRGRFEKELRGSAKRLDVNQGLINPKTGKPTGFLVATSEWKETVERLNQERDDAQAGSPWGNTAIKPKGPN